MTYLYKNHISFIMTNLKQFKFKKAFENTEKFFLTLYGKMGNESYNNSKRIFVELCFYNIYLTFNAFKVMVLFFFKRMVINFD